MSSTNSDDFGPNQGFVEDLYAAYLDNQEGVGPQWSEMFKLWKAEGRKPQLEGHKNLDASKGASAAQRKVHSSSDRAATPSTNVTRSDLPLSHVPAPNLR